MSREIWVKQNYTSTVYRRTLAGNKKYHATMMSIDIVLRILVILRDGGNIKRTNLAGMTRMNYGNCMKYVRLLMLLGWVDVTCNNDSHHVVITKSGTSIIDRFESIES